MWKGYIFMKMQHWPDGSPYCQPLLYFIQISFCFGKYLIILPKEKLIMQQTIYNVI